MDGKPGAAFAIAVFILFSASGCAPLQPTTEEYAAANYGEPITQEDAQALVVTFMNARLKDPESARYQWGVVSKGWSKDGLVYGGQTHFGYALQAMVNAKNSFGGYTGGEPYHFLFYNGRLVSVMRYGSDGINEKLL